VLLRIYSGEKKETGQNPRAKSAVKARRRSGIRVVKRTTAGPEQDGSLLLTGEKEGKKLKGGRTQKQTKAPAVKQANWGRRGTREVERGWVDKRAFKVQAKEGNESRTESTAM